MIGRIRYHAGRLLRADPVVIYHRDWLRKRVLRLPPLTGTPDTGAEIHVLTSEQDWMNTIWSLRSFYAYAPHYALAIHGDPTLSPRAVAELRRQFPQARVIEHRTATEAVLPTLREHPRCRRFRETNTLSMKVFDFLHFLKGDRMILFDSDLLFFARPGAFLAHLEPGAERVNVFNRDVATAYAVDVSVIEAAGFAIHPEVNSGFGLVHRESMPLDVIEAFLGIPGLPEGHFWRIEQTLYALCASRFGVRLLPDDYRVFLEGDVGDRPYRHYVGAVRDRMYREGMARLRGVVLQQ